jgi:N-acetylglucosamine-6-phosphate deacetylase
VTASPLRQIDLALEGTLLCPEELHHGLVLVAGDRIEWAGPREEAPAYTAIQRLSAPLIVPGAVDLHVHGGGGADVADATPEALELLCHIHARHGTTALCPTILASSPERTLRALEIIRASVSTRGATHVLGAHLEGPFLNPGKAGAQPPEHLRAPDPELLEEFLAAAGGTLRIVTLAPELPGALELVERLVEAGVLVSLGHSDATYAQARAAVDTGCRLATHTFNAMRGLHHREPGLAGEVLDDDRLTAEVIADGHHLAAPILRLLRRVKGAKVALITDCIAALEAPPGQARLGDRPVEVNTGTARLPDGTLAGSVLTMERAMANWMRLTGASRSEAAAASATVPAALLGRGDLGRIEAGFAADLRLLDAEMRLIRVVIRGQPLPKHAPEGINS